jgi:hypothetical protein
MAQCGIRRTRAPRLPAFEPDKEGLVAVLQGNLPGVLTYVVIMMVPGGGFEPPRETPHAPQACASAKFRHPGIRLEDPTEVVGRSAI